MAKEQQGSRCEESRAAQGEEVGDEVRGTPGVLTTQALRACRKDFNCRHGRKPSTVP